MSAQVAIAGNTYPVRDKLKALGARWDADRKVWTVPPSKADQARAIVDSAPAQAPPKYTGQCAKCHGPVKAPYIVCYVCKHPGEVHNAPRGTYAPSGRRCDICGSRECARAWNPRDLCDED